MTYFVKQSKITFGFYHNTCISSNDISVQKKSNDILLEKKFESSQKKIWE